MAQCYKPYWGHITRTYGLLLRVVVVVVVVMVMEVVVVVVDAVVVVVVRVYCLVFMG